MNIKKKNHKKSLHHNTYTLERIRKKIVKHGYDELTEHEILFISQEIESNKIPLIEVQEWMNQKKL